MLSAVLRSEIAIQVSIRIMETFVEMRRYMANNTLILERLNEVELKQLEYQKRTDERFEQVFDYIAEHEESTQKIFFGGQIYDAFSLLVDLVSDANKSIVLVDNFNMQYPHLEVKYTGVFHDRFLILDNNKAYHIGASLKDAGKKCFAISLFEDGAIIKDILQRLELEVEEKE